MKFSLAIVKAGLKAAGKEAVKHSPGIMAGLAIAGVATTAYLAFKSSPKAYAIVDAKKQDLDDIDETDKETRRKIRLEMVRELAPVMAPVVISGVITMILIFGSHSLNIRRQAVLSAAYSATQTAYQEYKDKTRSLVGPKKSTAIHDEIMNDHIEKAEAPTDKTIIVTGDGDYLCYDDYSGRFFQSNHEKIRSVINEINYRLISEMYISLNEFYDEIGLPPIKMGDDIGWNVDSGLFDVVFTTTLSKDNRPCLILNYDVEPRYDYRNLH